MWWYLHHTHSYFLYTLYNLLSISHTRSYGVSCNNDSVLRSVFYKYLHPKEVFIADGILVPDIARKKNSAVLAGSRKNAKAAAAAPEKKIRGQAPQEKLGFVYPYGVSLNVEVRTEGSRGLLIVLVVAG